MPFTIRNERKSRCMGCMHNMTIQPEKTIGLGPVSMCKLLGSMAMGPISECSDFLPHIHGPIPMHMMQSAWLLTPDKRGRSVGFTAPKTSETKEDE